MIVKFSTPKDEYGKNSGSVANLVDYLEKENKDALEIDKEYFFNHDGDYYSGEQVVNDIDSHKGKLAKDETKFYMFSVNPDVDEQNHIATDKDKFKAYIKDIMDEYAENFNAERVYKYETASVVHSQ